MDRWLSTDESLEAVLSLEMVADILPKVIENSHYWKWVLIALHNALQGYMVLALKGSDNVNILTPECAKAWKKVRRSGASVLPKRRLDNFLNLYKKIQAGRDLYDKELKLGRMLLRKPSDLMLMYQDSQPFKPRGTQAKSVKILNELRNDFVHFLPKSLVWEVDDLPRVVRDCIDIIEFLTFESENILWNQESLEQKTKDLISQVRTHLNHLNLSYGK